MKIQHLHFWQIKGIKIKIFCDYSLKKIIIYYFSTVVVSSSCSSTHILLNNSNIAYLWHNVFNKVNQTFILTGCCEYL